MNAKDTGALICELRKEHNWTQEQLAQKLGVEKNTVSKWECGRGYPDTEQLLPISRLFGISSDELMEGKIKDKPKNQTIYELACKLSNLSAVKDLLKNKNLNEKDENGNTFFETVLNNQNIELFFYCYEKNLYDVDKNGVFIIDNQICGKDKEASLFFLSSLESMSESIRAKFIYYNDDGSNNYCDEIGEKFSARNFSKEEMAIIIRMARKNYLTLRSIWRNNEHLPEILEKAVVDCGEDINFLLEDGWLLEKKTFLFTDKLVKYIIDNKIALNPKDYHMKIVDMEIYMTKKGFKDYRNYLLYQIGAQQLQDEINIEDEYKKGNLELIKRFIKLSGNSSVLYKFKLKDRYDRRNYYWSNEELEDIYKKEQSAFFFSKNYPEIVEMLIREGMGIPENTPNWENPSDNSRRGFDATFLNTSFMLLLNKIDRLEEKIEAFKKK